MMGVKGRGFALDPALSGESCLGREFCCSGDLRDCLRGGGRSLVRVKGPDWWIGLRGVASYTLRFGGGLKSRPHLRGRVLKPFPLLNFEFHPPSSFSPSHAGRKSLRSLPRENCN